jgi:hypothetical protein
VCTFSTTDLLRVIAFLDATRLMHFVGSSTPTMELLSLSNPGSVQCSTVAVSAYRATASSLFQGAPVVAAQQDTTRGGSTGLSPRVLIVAGSPSSLYSVSAQGAVTLVATVVKAGDLSPLSPYALAHTRVKPVGECDGAGESVATTVPLSVADVSSGAGAVPFACVGVGEVYRIASACRCLCVRLLLQLPVALSLLPRRRRPTEALRPPPSTVRRLSMTTGPRHRHHRAAARGAPAVATRVCHRASWLASLSLGWLQR